MPAELIAGTGPGVARRGTDILLIPAGDVTVRVGVGQWRRDAEHQPQEAQVAAGVHVAEVAGDEMRFRTKPIFAGRPLADAIGCLAFRRCAEIFAKGAGGW